MFYNSYFGCNTLYSVRLCKQTVPGMLTRSQNASWIFISFLLGANWLLISVISDTNTGYWSNQRPWITIIYYYHRLLLFNDCATGIVNKAVVSVEYFYTFILKSSSAHWFNNDGSNERNYRMVGLKVTEMKEWMNWTRFKFK